MGIYIEGISMPRSNTNIVIEIRDNKPVVVGLQDSYGYEDLEEEELKCNITEVKEPHGRLIDARQALTVISDILLNDMEDHTVEFPNYGKTYECIEAVPTVIEGED